MTSGTGTNPLAPERRRPKAPQSGPLARYSRFVGIMKVLLPAMAAVLLGLVVVWPKLTLTDSSFKIGFARLSTKEVESLAMNNARYFGIDESNRPFAVTSDRALQEPGKSDLVHLTAPKADFTSTSGANIVIDAESGLYHQNSKILDLSGGVNLFHDSGYELHTPTAVVDLAHNSARGTEPVEGFGPQGRIESVGFEISGKGHEITFAGKAHLSLRGASAKSPGKGRSKGAKRP